MSTRTKEENIEYMKHYRENNRERLREYNRTYNKLWRTKNGYHNEYASKKRYPEKEIARKILQKAIRNETIKRMPCFICGKPNGQGHHDDYSRPLDVRWLCSLHHKQLDMSCVDNKNQGV